MDLNKQIIEAVRQEPIIYGNNNSFEERNRIWKKLSDKLNTQEQYLKICWHSLVQRYQNEDDFKYAPHMKFLPRKPVTNPQEGGNWPEFVITEDDLQDQQQEGDEYEFVELEDNANKQQIKEEPDKENEIQYENTTTPLSQDKPIKPLRSPQIIHDKEKTPINIIIQSVDTFKQIATLADSGERRETNNNNNNNTPKVVNTNSELEAAKIKREERPLESPKTAGVKDTPTEGVERQKQPQLLIVESSRVCNESKKEEPLREEPKKIEPPPSRCEDDIFGELVAAMLKRMDEAKKKNIKKEIMNLLLT